jgi:hypothetical protein
LKIGIITTLNHNIGDDFVRIGIQSLLEEIFAGQAIEYVLINKHSPLTVYPRWHPLSIIGSNVERLPRGRRWIERHSEQLLYKLGKSRFHDCDLIVQSGAPVIFDGCGISEWSLPLWDHIIGSLYKDIRVWNLAAGSCYPWREQPVTIGNSNDALFLKRIGTYCRITSVRDRLAKELLANLGQDVSLLPCTAFLSGLGAITKANDHSPIFINYMEGAGHYSFGQKLSAELWYQQLREIVERLERRHKVEFICHTPKEFESTKRDFPKATVHQPRTSAQYYELIATAKTGLFNRLHASVALAGIGVPSVAVGTDTRQLMLTELGIFARFVGDVDVVEIEQAVENAISLRAQEQERLLTMRDTVRKQYRDLLTADLR